MKFQPVHSALLGVFSLLLAGTAFAVEPPCPLVPARHLHLTATQAAISRDRAIEIVAFGSSSTEGTGASLPDRTYPARLEAFLRTRWPGVAVTVRNRGIGGQTVEGMADRLENDVLAARPALVIWQVGTNESLRETDPDRFAALLDDGLKRMTAAGSDVILMDYQLAPKMPPEEKREVYGKIIAREASVRSVSLFSRASLMREWNATNPAENPMIGPDGLHHSERGYACLAAALGDAIVAAVAEPAPLVSAKLK